MFRKRPVTCLSWYQGYANADGNLMGWISELCYCRIDLNPKAPTDPWSKGAHRGLSHMCPGYTFQYFRSEGLNCYLLVLVIYMLYAIYLHSCSWFCVFFCSLADCRPQMISMISSSWPTWKPLDVIFVNSAGTLDSVEPPSWQPRVVWKFLPTTNTLILTCAPSSTRTMLSAWSWFKKPWRVIKQRRCRRSMRLWALTLAMLLLAIVNSTRLIMLWSWAVSARAREEIWCWTRLRRRGHHLLQRFSHWTNDSIIISFITMI